MKNKFGKIGLIIILNLFSYPIFGMESPISVKDFGAVGDGRTDDTKAFVLALAKLHQEGKGILYCPGGIYKIKQKLSILKPHIGIKGDGINITIFNFEGDGISLSSYIDFSFGVLEDFSVNGSGNANSGVPGTGTGILMNNSNYYFLNRILVSNFDVGISGTTAVLTRLTNFSVVGCRIGIAFSKGSFASTIFNGNVRGCREIAIQDDGSGIYISNTDVEAIYGTKTKPGIGIQGEYGTRIRDCHFETANTAIGINGNGGISVENCYIGGCANGIKQLQSGVLYGRYYFKNINFSDVGTEFDIPHLVRFEIEDCLAFTNKGANKAMVAKYDPLYGYIKGFNETINKGNYISYTVPGIEVNGVPLIKGHRLTLPSVSFGAIEPATTKTVAIKIQNTTKILDPYNDIIIGKFSNFKTPAGLILEIEIADVGQNTIEVRLTNTTKSRIDIGIRDFLISVLKN